MRKWCEYCLKNPKAKKCNKKVPEISTGEEKKDCTKIKDKKIRMWCEYCQKNPKAEKCHKKP